MKMHPLVQELASLTAKLIGHPGFNSCNLNRYGVGQFIKWHQDDEELFDAMRQPTIIASLTLGPQPRLFRLQRIGDHKMEQVMLAQGDICTMEGLLQKFYKHSVAHVTNSLERINLTFRVIRFHNVGCMHKGNAPS